MIIGIDATPAFKANKTGVEIYCFNIIRELAGIDTTHHYRLYVKDEPTEALALPDNFQIVVLGHAPLWTHTALLAELIAHPVDVFYSPGHVLPFYTHAPSVYTIHDAGFRHFRENYSRYQFLHAQINTFLSAKIAQKIVAISEFVANDVIKYYSLSPSKLAVVYNGYDGEPSEALSDDAAARALHELGIEGDYFVYVGRLEARKNVTRLIHAFADRVAEGQVDGQLVLLGAPGQGHEEIEAAVAARGGAPRILQPGYVSREVKAVVLRHARALVFPSLYEGFGMPIVEGFAAGVPVLTSTTTACAEVAGDAAVLVDPTSVEAIGEGLRRLWTDEALRETCRQRGAERCRAFSWSATADAVHRILLAEGQYRGRRGR
jgi:glycosyltransferase involved in cell wall biosynthesis